MRMVVAIEDNGWVVGLTLAKCFSEVLVEFSYVHRTMNTQDTMAGFGYSSYQNDGQ